VVVVTVVVVKCDISGVNGDVSPTFPVC